MKYYVILSERSDAILEILPHTEMKNYERLGKHPRVIAEKFGRRRAFEFVSELIGRVYSETGGFDVDTAYSA